MSIGSILNNDAAPDFNDPLGLLLACHQRILGFCDLLQRVSQHIKEHGVDNDARQSIKKIHHYFSTAGRFHHEDEEQDLFPLLISQSTEIATIVGELKQDHDRLDQAWAKLEPLLTHPETIAKTAEFDQWANEFCLVHRQHVSREEKDFFPVATNVLNAAQLQQLGCNMKKRRQADH